MWVATGARARGTLSVGGAVVVVAHLQPLSLADREAGTCCEGKATTRDLERVEAMKIDKNTILDLLRSRGEHDQAAQADRELPDQVDAEQHGGLLDKFGVNPKDLLGKLGGLGKRFGKE